MFSESSNVSSSGLVITRKLGDTSSQQQLDSLNYYGGNFNNKQIARLPIAPVTAKILQRGSFHEEEDVMEEVTETVIEERT